MYSKLYKVNNVNYTGLFAMQQGRESTRQY